MIRIDTIAAPKRWAVLLAGAVLLGACGGSDAADAGLESAAETTVAAAEADETTTTAAPAETTTTAAEVDDSAAYCAISLEADALSDAFTAFDDPAAFEAFLTERMAMLESAVAVVPDAIAADFTVVADAQRQLAQVAADSGYDITVVATEGVAIMETPEVTAAQEAVDSYDVQICGTTPDETAAAGDPGAPISDADMATIEALLETEAGRQAFAEGLTQGTELTIEQATCIVENGDIMGLMAVGSGTAEIDGEMMSTLLQTLDTCGIPLSAITG